MIFSQFQWKTRLTYRLVCKSWDERITYGGTELPLIIRCGLDNSQIVERLENFRFESINLKVEDNLNKETYDLPPVVWEKIGSKIRGLILDSSRVGDQAMKEILSNCDNLQYLRVNLKNGVPAESFCSLSMLESLENVAPKNLRKFEIRIDISNRKNFELASTTYHPEIWTNILEAFFRLFPKLTGFSYMCYKSGEIIHLCTFVREINQNEELKLATIMARSFSGSIRDTLIAMNTLVTLSLKKVAIKLSRKDFTNEEGGTFLNFFGRQKKLEDVHFTLYKVNRGGDEEMLRAIFLKIVQSCPDLRELYFCPEEPLLPWLHNVRELTRYLKLQKLSISGIEVWPNSLKFLESYKQADQGLMVMRFIPIYAHITSLSIKCEMTDKILQCVFQHMTNLKSLELLYCIGRNTDFAFTGHQDNISIGNAPIGYPINRLQNLERLSIIESSQRFGPMYGPAMAIYLRSGFYDPEVRKVTDNIFREFRFPRLQYLSCFPPYDLSLLANFGISMPVLRTIEFPVDLIIPLEALVNLCQSTKNLQTLILVKSLFSKTQIEELFQVCPTLQKVQCEDNVTVMQNEVEPAQTGRNALKMRVLVSKRRN